MTGVEQARRTAQEDAVILRQGLSDRGLAGQVAVEIRDTMPPRIVLRIHDVRVDQKGVQSILDANRPSGGGQVEWDPGVEKRLASRVEAKVLVEERKTPFESFAIVGHLSASRAPDDFAFPAVTGRQYWLWPEVSRLPFTLEGLAITVARTILRVGDADAAMRAFRLQNGTD